MTKWQKESTKKNPVIIQTELDPEGEMPFEQSDHQEVLIYNRNNGESIRLVKDWTDEEERKALWKVDLIVMPILWLGFFALQMDRGNISNAKTSTLLEDLNMTQNQFNVGIQLMSAGIVIFEIPSNIILQKIGPRYWLGIQIILWSFVAIFQAFCTNYSQYLATRVLLGIFESGYIPGSLYLVSVWWKRSELSLRTSIFYTGTFVTAAVCPLISAGILKDLTGKHGWSGWRWLFLIEGLVSFFIAILYCLTIPDSPKNPSPIWSKKIKYFNDRERHILLSRILLDDPNKFITTKDIRLSDIKEAFLEWRVWVHFFISAVNSQMTTAVGAYTPSLIYSFGYSVFKSNALTSIGYWVTVVALLLFSYITDKKQMWGLMVLISCTWQSAMSIALRTMPHIYPREKKFAIITLFNSVLVQHVLNASWLSINIKSPVTRNISMAIIIMGANIGQITGGQIFRGADAPYYPKGFTAILVCQIVVTIVVALNILQYVYSNKRLDKNNKLEKANEIKIEQEKVVTDNIVSKKGELIIVGRYMLGNNLNLDEIALKYPDFELDEIHDIHLEQKEAERYFRFSP